MTSKPHRFHGDQRTLREFGDRFLVVCPRCDRCARVQGTTAGQPPAIRLTCLHCGRAEDWIRTKLGIVHGSNENRYEKGQVSLGAPVDFYFHRPLWLQLPCLGRTLWAYNETHLAWLKAYVSASLRERDAHEKWGWSNQSLVSRLPRWIKKKSHREAILSVIERLEDRIESSRSKEDFS